MSGEAVLNQDEIDALLHGMKQGTVTTDPGPVPRDVRQYDLGTEARMVRGCMPTLELINEKLRRLYRASLYSILRRDANVASNGIKTLKYGDYVRSLRAPSSINLVTLEPLRGLSLIVIAPELVALTVDGFFGGKGRAAAIEGRDFTTTETRVIQLLLQSLLADLKEAWSGALTVKVTQQGTETNPQFANALPASEIIVVTAFSIEIDGGSGDLQIVIPYASLEPLRDRLAATAPADAAAHDAAWANALREEIEDCDVTLTTVFGHGNVTLANLLNLKPGDIVPCDFQGRVTVYAEDVPILRGGFGTSRGQMAVQVAERLIGGRAPADPPTPGR